MKKKIIIGGVVVLALLVAALLSIPFLFKDKINSRVKEEINKQVTAQVDYGDFSLSLLRSFPNFNFSLSDFSIVGKEKFKGDTLAYIKNFGITIDLMSVLRGEQYKILALTVDHPVINALVNYDGQANWDIMKPSEEKKSASESSSFSLAIKQYKIAHAEISYQDKKANRSARLHDFNFQGSGNVAQEVYDFTTQTDIAALTYRDGTIVYLNNAKLAAAINLNIDNTQGKYTFKENTISLNDLGLQFDGWLTLLKDKMNMDVTFAAKQTEFKHILSLIPSVYKKDFDKIKTSGNLSLKGSVKGMYAENNFPSFTLDLGINNGMFQYPDLPVAVKNIFLTSRVAKPQGSLDATVIDVSKLHLEAGNDPIDARINVRTPVSDPNVKANILGRLDMANVPKFYPMEGLKKLTGLLVMNLNFSGKMSDVDKKNYEAISASGNLKVNNLVYDSKETPMPVKVSNLQMTFTPQNVALNSLQAVLGKSDFNVTGSLDNFMGYAFGKGDLTGSLNLRSTNFDANEWLQKDNAAASSATADTVKTQFFKVPAHIDFTANSEFGKISYEKILLTNVKGQVIIRDEAIRLTNLSAHALGGNANISAVYSTKHQDFPDVDFSYDIKNFDIGQTYAAAGMAQKIAPVMKFIQGNFSSDLKGSGKLNPDMSVDYNSLTGDGKVEIPEARVVNLPLLTEITKVAKIPALQNLELKNAWTVLKFKDGKVFVEPTEIKFGNGYNIQFNGANGFDESIDYNVKLNVPSKDLGPATSLAQGMLSKVPGLNVAMPDVVGFLFKVTGKAAKPQVKLNGVSAGGGSAKDMVKGAAEDLKQEVQKQAEDLKQKAEQELQKQKQEAEQKAREAVEKAKQDAQQKAKEAADKAKKDAEQKVKDLFKFPR